MDFLHLFGVLACFLLALFVVQIVRICLSDCDLQLRGSKLKPAYFDKKNVWVVGASGAIGEALCHRLSSLGTNLILSGLPNEMDRLESIRDSLERPQNVRILPLDLCDSESLPMKTQEAVKAFGHIDILLLTAGILQFGFFVGVPESIDRKVFEVVFFGQRRLIQTVLPDMMNRKCGHIVAVSSATGKIGNVLCTSYSAAKFALTGLLETLREEIHDSGVNITTVFPGGVNTPMLQAALLNDGKTLTGKNPVDTHLFKKRAKQYNMTADRCAELTLVAASNQYEESWMGKLPILPSLYLRQYCPWLYVVFYRHLISKFVIAEFEHLI
jgi:short-subunit dehydrogenase